jgi:hypothetical protein
MGNRTVLRTQICSCSPEQVDDVLGLLEEHGLDGGDPAPFALGPTRHAQLELGAWYSRMEAPVGSTDELAGALPTEAAWKVWEDPAYEHLGQVHLHHPDWGGSPLTATPAGSRCSPAARSTTSWPRSTATGS